MLAEVHAHRGQVPRPKFKCHAPCRQWLTPSAPVPRAPRSSAPREARGHLGFMQDSVGLLPRDGVVLGLLLNLFRQLLEEFTDKGNLVQQAIRQDGPLGQPFHIPEE